MVDQQDEVTPLEYLVSALVILSFGLLYFLINHGFSFWKNSEAEGMLSSMPVVQEAEVVKPALAISADDNLESAKQEVSNQAEQRVERLAAAQDSKVKEAKRLQDEAERLLTEKNKLDKERLAEVESVREQLEQERLRSEEATNKLDEVKKLLAEEVERNKAAREQVEKALSLQALSKQKTAEAIPQRSEQKRQAYKLPDGTEVMVPDSGFEGTVKAAMVERNFNEPLLFDAIQFESGSSRLVEGSEDQIKVVAALMNTYKDIKVLIRGHTDSTGQINANSLLSLTRSGNMKKQLLGLGIDPARVKIEGVGELEPLASNDSEEGRNKNRRIELILIE